MTNRFNTRNFDQPIPRNFVANHFLGPRQRAQYYNPNNQIHGILTSNPSINRVNAPILSPNSCSSTTVSASLPQISNPLHSTVFYQRPNSSNNNIVNNSSAQIHTNLIGINSSSNIYNNQLNGNIFPMTQVYGYQANNSNVNSNVARNIISANNNSHLNTNNVNSNSNNVVLARGRNSSFIMSPNVNGPSQSLNNTLLRGPNYSTFLNVVPIKLDNNQVVNVKLADDVQFKRNIFHNVESVLIKPFVLYQTRSQEIDENKFLMSHNISLDLSPVVCDRIFKSRNSEPSDSSNIPFDLNVIARFYCFGPNSINYNSNQLFCVQTGTPVDDTLPPHLNISVNDTPCQLHSILPSNKPYMDGRRSPKPIVLTHLLNLNTRTPSKNTIKFSLIHYSTLNQFYMVGIYLASKNSYVSAANELAVKRVISFEDIKTMIRYRLGGTSDPNDDSDELQTVTNEVPVELNCKLLPARIKMPVRTKKCTHLSSFCFYNFLTLNEKKAFWTCPLCKEPAAFEDLYVDGYLQSILQNPITLNKKEVLYLPDGSWTISSNKGKKNSIRDSAGNLKKKEADNDDSSHLDHHPVVPPVNHSRIKRTMPMAIDLCSSESEPESSALSSPQPVVSAPSVTPASDTPAIHTSANSNIPNNEKLNDTPSTDVEKCLSDQIVIVLSDSDQEDEGEKNKIPNNFNTSQSVSNLPQTLLNGFASIDNVIGTVIESSDNPELMESSKLSDKVEDQLPSDSIFASKNEELLNKALIDFYKSRSYNMERKRVVSNEKCSPVPNAHDLPIDLLIDNCTIICSKNRLPKAINLF